MVAWFCDGKKKTDRLEDNIEALEITVFRNVGIILQAE